jgi:hypothetical protein
VRTRGLRGGVPLCRRRGHAGSCAHSTCRPQGQHSTAARTHAGGSTHPGRATAAEVEGPSLFSQDRGGCRVARGRGLGHRRGRDHPAGPRPDGGGACRGAVQVRPPAGCVPRLMRAARPAHTRLRRPLGPAPPVAGRRAKGTTPLLSPSLLKLIQPPSRAQAGPQAAARRRRGGAAAGGSGGRRRVLGAGGRRR